MTGVLTKASTVDCGHGGRVSTEGAAKLTVSGKGVLLKSGVSGKTVSTACSNQDNTTAGTVKCKTLTVTGGEATKLTVGGKAVMLDTLTGTTEGVPPTPPPYATAVQTKLKAI